MVFVMSLCALFLGPFFAGHEIVHHAIVSSASGCGPAIPVVMSRFKFTIVLFMTFGIYLVWDVLIWLSRSGKRDYELDGIVNRWVKMDAIIILVFMTLGVFQLYLRARGQTISFELIALSFVGIASGVTIVDYGVNNRLYFPDVE